MYYSVKSFVSQVYLIFIKLFSENIQNMNKFDESGLELEIQTPFTTSQSTPQNVSSGSYSQPRRHQKQCKTYSPIAHIDIILPHSEHDIVKTQAHGKTAFKKLGAKHLKTILKATRNSTKTKNIDSNIYLFSRLQESYSQMLKAKHGHKQISSTVRSYSREKVEGNSMGFSKSTAVTSKEIVAISVNKDKGGQSALVTDLQQQKVDQIFREVNRKLQKEEQTAQFLKNKKKCFYTKLKEKLQKQIRNIKTKKENKDVNMTNLLLDGCYFNNHQRNYDSATFNRTPLSHSPRKRSGLSRTGLEINLANTERYRRPKSSRDRNLERREFQYAKKHALDKNFKRAKSARSNQNKKEQMSISNNFQLDYSKTLNSARSQRVRSNKKSSIVKQKSKQKLLNILVECENEKLQSEGLRKGMKIFGFYCRKMSSGMQHAQQKLGQCINESNSYDLQVLN